MPEIAVLNSKTIDQIAAGEVVERPSSVVKELVENACDAGATAVTVEIKDGGTTFLRVTDNGSGIPKDQVKKAFYRHATSKIRDVDDLACIQSLGFRGEALSSIAAVSMVEMITKTPGELTGVRYTIEGDRERDFSEIGAPDGTTIIVRELFFNTPARKKFLKTAATEGGYIAELMEHMALSRPDISFQFMANRQIRFQTSGSGDLKEIIFSIYGRQIAKEIFPVSAEENGLKMEGFLGTPLLVRPNRNFEFFFVNRRYIKSQVLSKGLESGYKAYLMQHKFPMAYLHLAVDTALVDVNVHPAKMEVRFSDNQRIFDFIDKNVNEALHSREMIPSVTLGADTDGKAHTEKAEGTHAKGPAGKLAEQLAHTPRPQDPPIREAPRSDSRAAAGTLSREAAPKPSAAGQPPSSGKELPPQPFEKKRFGAMLREQTQEYGRQAVGAAHDAEQLNLFDEKILSRKAAAQYDIIGQVFDTYWLASYQDKMIIIDQHAAHEKVKYEALIRQAREGKVVSQSLLPPVIVTLSPAEAAVLTEYMEYFEQLGFEIEDFGGSSYALRSVPCDLYGNTEADFLQEVLDELQNDQRAKTPQAVSERIATMACKSAVRGNHRMSREEMKTLLDQLLDLENPYHCPHGRPTMIVMTKQELEKKFKRIV